MRKVNLWNHLFHSGELLEQEKQYQRLGIIIDTYPSLKKNLTAAAALSELLAIHKQAWGFGYQNKALGPCQHGMFRTEDILEMKPEEVYLGNIYGLWTFNIPEWERSKDEVMGGNGFGLDPSIRCYDLVKQQYYRLLCSNIDYIYNDAVEKKGHYQIYGWIRRSRQ